METITFDKLPEAVAGLYRELAGIRLMLAKQQPKKEPTNQWFDLSTLCEYLPEKPAKQTVYQWVSEGKIPYHKGNKRLRFLKSEIDGWLMAGKRKTVEEIKAEAGQYLK